MTIIRGTQLTTFEVAPDGESISLHVMDEQAQPATLVLPSDCLHALMMTLPAMVRQSLRLRFRDPSMCVVYPVCEWEVERSAVPGSVVVTLCTPDGFAVSFGLPALELLNMSAQGASSDPRARGIISN